MKDSITDKMQRILTALEADESLQDCFLEMIDTTEDKQKKFTNGDDAEDAFDYFFFHACLYVFLTWKSSYQLLNNGIIGSYPLATGGQLLQ